MKKAEAAAEFSGILRLLREHAFLKYSSTGRQEYDQRLLSASNLFANLVSRATGMVLPSPARYAELDKVSDGNYTGLLRTVNRLVARLRRIPASCSVQEARNLEKMRLTWEKAAMILSRLPD